MNTLSLVINYLDILFTCLAVQLHILGLGNRSHCTALRTTKNKIVNKFSSLNF